MPFQKGVKRAPTAGRRAGTPNKRTSDLYSVLEKHDFCPASALIEIYTEAKKVYQSYGVIYEAIVQAKSQEQGYPAIVEDKADKYLKIACDAAKELATYCYPKRKSVEQTADPKVIELIGQYEKLSDEQLLQIVNKKS